MNENRKNRLRRYGIALLSAAGLLILGGALLSWSWNASIGELFGLPQMAFRQAVAAEVLLGIVFAIAAWATRFRHRGPERPGSGAAS